MKYTIINNMVCKDKNHYNFEGEYDYVNMEQLATNMINKSKWDYDIKKKDIPVIAMTTFKHHIRSTDANPTSLIALDFDDVGNDIERAKDFFDGHAIFLYTSYSHTKDHHKFRVMLKLDIEITNNEESHIIFSIIERRLKDYGLILDRQCKDISRRFYLPAYDINAKIPVLEYMEGYDYPVMNDFEVELKNLLIQKEKKEIERALSKMKNIGRKQNKGNIKERKQEEAMSLFLSAPSHAALGSVIGSLRFWCMDHDEIISWCMANYNPSTGNCRAEIMGWMRWHDRKNALNFDEKY